MIAPVPTEASASDEIAAPRRSPHRTAIARRDSTAPLPANLGSVDDYEHQDGDDSSSSPRSASSRFSGSGGGFATPGNFGAANLQFDPGNDRHALTNNLVLGALVIGLFAIEVQAAHQHHHHR